MTDSVTKIGIIGCGNISGIYFTNGKKLHGIEVAACADLKPEAAQARAKEFGITRVLTPAELLKAEDIGIVLNLTIPAVHTEVDRMALEAGKSVYGEKPLALSMPDAEAVLKLAESKGLRVGSAPDTFLGAGIQTCRALIEQGVIGRPVAATAFMMCAGHESWHPAPAFYYQKGGGPMLDMGPYYLTALVSLLGPVRRVAGSTTMAKPERLITSEPLKGTRVKVETPTHLAGVLDFEGGAVATVVTSFDVQHHTHSPIEIYGTEGSLCVPDPNTFGGPVKVRRHDEKEWREVPLTRPFAENSRGLGVADMAAAIRAKRPHRASGELALHVLETMLAFEKSSTEGKHVVLKTRCARPEALPENGVF